MIIVPFEPEHARQMQHQPHQAALLSCVSAGYVEALGAYGPAYSALEDDRVVACAGIAVQGFGMGTMWAFIARNAGRRFVRLDRAARRLIEIQPLRRLEASSEIGFEPGCRWLELLGFHSEGLMRKYGPHGEDHVRYARVT